MKKGIILILFLLLSKLSICQTGYPKILLPGSVVKDTIVGLLPYQAAYANTEHLYNLQYKETIDTMQTAIDTCRYALSICDSVQGQLREIIDIQQSGINERDILIDRYTKEDQNNKKEIRKLKLHRTLLAISIGIIIAVYFL